MPTQITADLPTLNFPREVDYPTQEDWAAFSAAAELNFGILGGDWSTQMQLWKDQANGMSIELNNNADIAQAVANYQGDWVSQGYTLGQTVSVGEVYYICKLTHATGQNPTDSASLYWNLALGNWNLKVDTNMSGYSSKTTPVDADLILLSDNAASFGIKKLSWANLKATLKTYFDTLYIALAGNQTITGKKSFTDDLINVLSGTYSSSTNIITVILNVTSHNLAIGDYINVKGITNSQASTGGSLINFNGYFKVTAQTATTITYTISTLLGTVSSTALTGTITFTSGGLYLDSIPKIKLGNNYFPLQGATAYINFDGTTTPPTIRGSYNVSAVIRTATGIYDIYFKDVMDSINYTTSGARDSDSSGGIVGLNTKTLNKVTINSIYNLAYNNGSLIDVNIFGGKN